MKYFIDTEFIEDGKTIELISIGIVAEDGRTYYAISSEFDPRKANDWVKENVLPKINKSGSSILTVRDKAQITQDILELVGDDPNPKFWGYYCDYDWVLLCQLYGTMMDLPKGWPMYCRDIKQACDWLGNPKLPKQGKSEHHALADALWIKSAYEFLRDYQSGIPDCA